MATAFGPYVSMVLRGDVVEGFVPAHLDELAVLAHHRARDRALEVVHLTRCSALRARVALGQRMLLVTANLQDLVTGNLGDKSAVMHTRQYVRLSSTGTLVITLLRSRSRDRRPRPATAAAAQ
jgi:hypothetical protein